jgi:hypothetical protein
LTAFQVLSAAAVAFVIARAGVFAWLRRGRKGWIEFISCPLCVGFWVGLVFGTARLYLWRSGSDSVDFTQFCRIVAIDGLDLVAGGALVGVTALLYVSVIDWLDALEQAANRLAPAPKDHKTSEIRELVREALGEPETVFIDGEPWPAGAKPAVPPPERPGEP